MRQIMAKEKAANKILRSTLLKHSRNIRVRMYANHFLSDANTFEQKSTQNLGSRQPILLLIYTSDYNVTITIIILVTKGFFTHSRYSETFNKSRGKKVHKHYFSQ